jgi:hypothetical protein
MEVNIYIYIWAVLKSVDNYKCKLHYTFQQSKGLNYTTAEASNLAKMKSYFLAGVKAQVV